MSALFIRRIFRTASCLVLAASFVVPAFLQAGERIEIGSASSSKVAPAKDSNLGKELFKWKRQVDSDPFAIDLSTPILPRNQALNPRKEKERREKMQKERNWILVDPKDAQAREDEQNKKIWDNADVFLSDKNSDEWLYEGISKHNSQRPANPTGRTGNQRPERYEPPSEDRDMDDLMRLSPDASKSDIKVASHLNSAMDFKRLLNPDVRDAGSKSDALPDNLTPSSSLGLTADQQEMREKFKNFLNGSMDSIAPAAPSASWRSELTSPALTPALPKVESSPLLGGGMNSLNTLPSRNSAIMDSPMARDWANGVSGFGTLPPANLSPTPSRGLPSSPEPFRARGMNSLGGH